MRTNVAQRERFSGGVAPEYKRDIHSHGSHEPADVKLFAAQRRVPKAPQQLAVDARRGHTRNGERLIHDDPQVHVYDIPITRARNAT